jgi:hypothetical protein
MSVAHKIAIFLSLAFPTPSGIQRSLSLQHCQSMVVDEKEMPNHKLEDVSTVYILPANTSHMATPEFNSAGLGNIPTGWGFERRNILSHNLLVIYLESYLTLCEVSGTFQ